MVDFRILIPCEHVGWRWRNGFLDKRNQESSTKALNECFFSIELRATFHKLACKIFHLGSLRLARNSFDKRNTCLRRPRDVVKFKDFYHSLSLNEHADWLISMPVPLALRLFYNHARKGGLLAVERAIDGVCYHK